MSYGAPRASALACRRTRQSYAFYRACFSSAFGSSRFPTVPLRFTIGYRNPRFHRQLQHGESEDISRKVSSHELDHSTLLDYFTDHGILLRL